MKIPLEIKYNSAARMTVTCNLAILEFLNSCKQILLSFSTTTDLTTRRAGARSRQKDERQRHECGFHFYSKDKWNAEMKKINKKNWKKRRNVDKIKKKKNGKMFEARMCQGRKRRSDWKPSWCWTNVNASAIFAQKSIDLLT